MASYPIPPWLAVSPADFGSAAAKGAEIRLQRARLAEEARQANLRASMASAELSARTQAAQQQAQREAVEQQFQQQLQQAQLGLRTRQLDQAETSMNLDIQTAGRKMQAQMEAQQRIAAGEPPAKVWAELGPAAGVTGSGVASLIRTPMQQGAAKPIEGLPGYKSFETSSGHFQVIPESSVPNEIRTIPVIGPDGQPMTGTYGVPGGPGRPATVHNVPQEKESDAIGKLIQQRQQKKGGAAETKKPIATQKRERAEQLAAQHPDWPKERIIAVVNEEFRGK